MLSRKRKYNRRIQSDFKEEICLRSSLSFDDYVDTDMLNEGISRGFQIRESSIRHAREMPRRNVRRSRASERLSCR